MANLKYFLIRIGLFAVVFTVCMFLQIGGVMSAVFAAIITFAISYLFLSRSRADAAAQLAAVSGKRPQRKDRAALDGEAEDAEVEASADTEQPHTPVRRDPSSPSNLGVAGHSNKEN